MTYERSDTKKRGADPRETAARILENLKPSSTSEPTYRCHVCRDVGWVELLPGAKFVAQSGARLTVPEGGPGVFQRCKGLQGSGCRYAAWRQEEGAKEKARDGKPAGGEEAPI